MTLYKDRYRVETTRLKGWNYSSTGYYFVTICTKEKECLLGEVINAEMRLSRNGEIVAEEWQKTEQVRDNVKLDKWIIMPNHLHGVLIIEYKDVETTRRVVSTLKPNSLGSIVGQFKSITTKRIRMLGYSHFAWQSGFYDHIIRSERSLRKIQEYIINNSLKWELDEYNPDKRK